MSGKVNVENLYKALAEILSKKYNVDIKVKVRLRDE